MLESPPSPSPGCNSTSSMRIHDHVCAKLGISHTTVRYNTVVAIAVCSIYTTRHATSFTWIVGPQRWQCIRHEVSCRCLFRVQVFRPLNGLSDAITAACPPLNHWRSFRYCLSMTGELLGEVDHFAGKKYMYVAQSNHKSQLVRAYILHYVLDTATRMVLMWPWSDYQGCDKTLMDKTLMDSGIQAYNHTHTSFKKDDSRLQKVG
jgi:hypothetical protein